MKIITKTITTKLHLIAAVFTLSAVTSFCEEQNHSTNAPLAVSSIKTSKRMKGLTLEQMWHWMDSSNRGSLLMVEFKNATDKPIKAFKLDLAILDDFGDQQDTIAVKFTSRSKYCNSEGACLQGHIIQPGEVIRWCEWSFRHVSMSDFGDSYYLGGGNNSLTKEFFTSITPQVKMSAKQKSKFQIRNLKVAHDQ